MRIRHTISSKTIAATTSCPKGVLICLARRNNWFHKKTESGRGQASSGSSARLHNDCAGRWRRRRGAEWDTAMLRATARVP